MKPRHQRLQTAPEESGILFIDRWLWDTLRPGPGRGILGWREVGMRRFLCMLSVVAGLGAAPAWGQSYQLVWQDEFNGTQVDLSKWEPQVGDGCPSLCGWGNNELQYYRSQNATVAGGFLTITARRENVGGRNYTSARLRTKNRGDFKYGRIEMRAKMPVGRGLWPALWMLPTDEVYGIWAASGEIDILEYLGHQPAEVFGTLHFGGTYPQNQSSSNLFTLTSGTFNAAFHDFAFEWEPCEMRWYVDGELYATQTDWNSTGGPYPAPFDQRFHLLLNMAVGGNLPGSPDVGTVFPQTLVVDYVRVYQMPDFNACVLEFDGMDHAAPFANGWFTFAGSVGNGGIGANLTDLPPLDGCRASLETGWGSGGRAGFVGGFGRTHRMNLTGMTHFNLWLNPDAGQQYTLEINLQEDDNGDDIIPSTPTAADDEFQFSCLVGPTGPHAIAGGGWQRVSIPLASFADDNSYYFGGNGIFDPVPVSAGGNGRLVNVVVSVISTSGANVTFRTDRWAFSRQTSSVSGRVWEDANGDGVPNAAEPGYNGVRVDLFDTALGAVTATSLTASDGNYNLDMQPGAHYEVRVDPAMLPASVAPTADPDGIASPHRFALDLACDLAVVGQNFGYVSTASDAPVFRRADVLRQNVPNPFNPSTWIEFELSTGGPAEIAVYDIAGRWVNSLTRATLPAGLHRIEWDGRDAHGAPAASGVYCYSLRTAQGHWMKRMVLLR